MIIIEVQSGVVTCVSTDSNITMTSQSVFVVDWDNKEDENGNKCMVSGPMFDPLGYDALRAVVDHVVSGATPGTLEDMIIDHIKRQGQLTKEDVG